jgi:predicted AAA+ superfamily ATPase
MIKREVSAKLIALSKQYPVITITGPRQSGKTTLCKSLFSSKKYVNLEDPETRMFAASDPKGFLSRFTNGAVIDEIQRAPELLSYLQVIVDEHKAPGEFIITGSQNILLLSAVSQSLAGRTAIIHLLPLSVFELTEYGLSDELDEFMYKGFYPNIYNLNLNPSENYSFYISTYVEKDIRDLLKITDLNKFELFLKICASRTGQIVNFSSMGNDCGLSHNTVKQWLSLLETSYIIKLSNPYYKNYGKRFIKSPKLYFIDTGLLCYLLGIRNKGHVDVHPLKGQIFETFAFSELLKTLYNEAIDENIYFLRDTKGYEIDFILEAGIKLKSIEVKLSQTVSKDFFKNLNTVESLTGIKVEKYLIYGGSEAIKYKDISIIPWQNIHSIIRFGENIHLL